MTEVLASTRRATAESGLAPYDIRGQGGFWRFLVLRDGRRTGERMLHLITWPGDAATDGVVDRVLERVVADNPGLTSVLHGTSGRLASVAYAESTRVVHGAATIRERLLDDEFTIGPDTFFQTNTLQAERLFTRALEQLGGVVDRVWDLYCGVGALTLPLARRAGFVVGAELIEASVIAARTNAQVNGVANVEFVAVDMKEAITADGLVDRNRRLVSGPPDLVVVDPPRDGLHADVTTGLLALSPPRIIYVSCNPATLARDAGRLVEGGYLLESVTPVDMFPQTAHVEVVAVLRRE
jgi:23S rRNA (uracil1939-C5)-methyltransferase